MNADDICEACGVYVMALLPDGEHKVCFLCDMISLEDIDTRSYGNVE